MSYADPNLSKKERKEARKNENKTKNVRNSQGRSSFLSFKAFVWILILAILGGLIYVTAFQNDQDPNLTYNDEYIKGNPNANVELVEYSDFQCPACAAYYPLVKQLNNDFPNDLKIIYRHFPLERIHRNAFRAAQATEAAGQQGKFWEMHDIIFENQRVWSNSTNVDELFEQFAEEIGLEQEKFLNDIDDRGLRNKIKDHMNLGRSAGVTGTPSFYLNGVKVENVREYEDFKKLVEQEIEKSGKASEAEPQEIEVNVVD